MTERDKGPTQHSKLSEFFEPDASASPIGQRIQKLEDPEARTLRPPFPRQIQVEISNICNHGCVFCAYPKMQRPKRHMDRELFHRLVAEAHEAGAREIGLFAGAEPLTCKWLDEYVEYCTELGYEYIYISTNGSLADEERFRRLLDAGLSSIKFSVNAGERSAYEKVHGKDDFDRVIRNIRFVSEYRRSLPRPVYLAVSYVDTPLAGGTFEALERLLDGVVDEIIFYEASNQSGQMEGLPLPPYRDCALPFNKLHITREGYLRACCNDYENLLALEDLNEMSLLEAWHSARFRDLRRRHLEDRLDGTLCGKCIRSCKSPAAPLNASLGGPGKP